MTDTRAHMLIARPAWCARVMAWTKDPQVPFEGKKSSLFDLLEDLDYDDCLSKAQAIAGVKGERPAGKMQAYVFIKPHAVRSRTRMSRARTLLDEARACALALRVGPARGRMRGWDARPERPGCGG